MKAVCPTGPGPVLVRFRTITGRPTAERDVTFFRRYALCILFTGTGMALAVPFLTTYWSLPLPDWVVERFSLLVTIPALLLSVHSYTACGGFARSWPLMLFMGWMATTLVWVDPTERGRGILAVVNLGITFPLASVVRSHGNPRQCILWFAMAYVGSMVVVAFSGAAYLDRFGDFSVEGRPLMNSNQVGMLGVIVAVLVYGYLAESSGENSGPRAAIRQSSIWFAVFLALTACTFAILTVSRTAGVSLAAAGALVTFRHAPRLPLLVAVSPLLITLALAAALSTGIADRWQGRLFDSDMRSFNGRTDIWDQLWTISRQPGTQWLRGVGCGGCDKLLGEDTEIGVVHPRDGIVRVHSHNLYLEWFVELGLVGVLLSSYVVTSILARSRYQDRRYGSIYRVSLLVVLAIYAMSGVPTKNPAFPGLAALLWAALSPLQKDKENRLNERRRQS